MNKIDEILEKILNVYRIPQELLKNQNGNLSTIKSKNEQLRNKLNMKIKE